MYDVRCITRQCRHRSAQPRGADSKRVQSSAKLMASTVGTTAIFDGYMTAIFDGYILFTNSGGTISDEF